MAKATMMFANGTIKGYQLANKFAGDAGHVATMPEIVDAKLAERDYNSGSVGLDT